MAIYKGQINGNPDTMVEFINEYTSVTGVSAIISVDAGQRHLAIGLSHDDTFTPICQCNNVNTGDNQRAAGSFFMFGGGSAISYGTPYLPTIGYASSKGLLFPVNIDSTTNQAACFLISKTNNGYYGSACQLFGNSSVAYASGHAQALGDKPFESGQASSTSTTMFPQHAGTSTWVNVSYARDQIQLVPIPTRGDGVISYFPHAFWIPNSPTRQYGVYQIGDKKYAMSSYMALEE